MLLLRCAYVCEFSIRFTNQNLHIFSSVRYFVTAQGCYDLELERAASERWTRTGFAVVRRWLCRAFQKKWHSNDFSDMHPGPRTTRIIQVENSAHIFLSCHWQVGRYLVTAETGLFVWNLGYVSTEELLQSFAFLHGWQGSCHPFVLYLIPSFCNCPRFIFEIYPAEWNTFNTNPNCPSWLLFLQDDPAHLLPDILICRAFYEGRIYFTLAVVGYRTNYWFWSTEGVSLWWAAPHSMSKLKW